MKKIKKYVIICNAYGGVKMDDNQEKVIFYIVLFLIIIICLSVFVKGYESNKNKEVSSNDTSYSTVIYND